MPDVDGFDVFFSYSRADEDAVEAIAERLRSEEGLRPFLDRWHLSPGVRWQEELEAALAGSASAAVFVGASGQGAWQVEEMHVAVDRAAGSSDDFRVIPVLLPGADPAALDGFLAQRTWVDFRAGLDDAAALQRLAGGIRGEAYSDDSFELPDEPAPYRGLYRFEPADESIFFGRDDDTALLIDMLATSAFVAVVGASGSGKSSLVRAGLIPALERTRLDGATGWTTLICTPGSDPFRSLAEQVAHLAPPATSLLEEVDLLTERFRDRDDGLITAVRTYSAARRRPVLLVIDQFEELYTLAGDDSAWRDRAARFVANLATAAADPDATLKMVVTLRADFVGPALSVDGMAALLQHRQVMLGALTGTKLRDAIVRPAEQVGALFEKGLVATIIDDVDTEPGALPMLQHALYELWIRRRGPWLTIDAYDESGGVVGALSATAETVYERLPRNRQAIAKRVFVRLTTLGEGVPDTRRRAGRSELYPTGTDPGDVDAVLAALSGQHARLIVVGEDTVEVAHEALLRNWPTLRTWLDDDREALRVHRRLGRAANEWANDHDRDPASLYRGARLAEAVEYADAHADDLDELEAEFVEASTSLTESELAAEQERSRRLRWRLVAATAAFVVAVAGVVVAVYFLLEANRATSAARDATSSALGAGAEVAVSRDPELAALLALQADGTSPTPASSRAMYRVIASGWERTLTRERVSVVASSRDGSRIATKVNRGIVVWDADGAELATLPDRSVVALAFNEDGSAIVAGGVTGADVWDADFTQRTALTGTPVDAVAFSRDGTRVVTGGNEGAAVWELDGTLVVSLPGVDVDAVALDHDGTRVVTGAFGRDGASLWDVDGELIGIVPTGSAFVNSVAFSPDGTTLLIAHLGGVDVWDVSGIGTGDPRLDATLDARSPSAAAFSQDGTQIVTAGVAGAELWDVSGNRLVTVTGEPVRAMAVDDRGRIVTGSSSDGATVWAVRGNQVARLSQGSVSTVDFDHDGTRVLTGTVRDEAARWDIDGNQLDALPADSATTFAFNHDGTRIVTGGPFEDTVLWDLEGRRLATLSAQRPRTVAFNHDGTRIVAGTRQGAVMWDLDGVPHATFRTASPIVNSVAFNHDGTQVATASDDGLEVWDTDGDRRETLTEDRVDVVAFNHDGTRLAAASGSDVVVWEPGGDRITTFRAASDVDSVAFNHDGTRLLTGTHRGAVMWDLDGNEVAEITDESVRAVAFNHDGTLVVTGGPAGAVVWKVWEVAAMRDELVRRLGDRRFDPVECARYAIDPCPGAG